MRVPRAVAKFNRRITNPLALSLGGWAPLQGTLEHVGRKSGKRYRTPLNIFETDDGYLAASPSATESNPIGSKTYWPADRQPFTSTARQCLANARLVS